MARPIPSSEPIAERAQRQRDCREDERGGIGAVGSDDEAGDDGSEPSGDVADEVVHTDGQPLPLSVLTVPELSPTELRAPAATGLYQSTPPFNNLRRQRKP